MLRGEFHFALQIQNAVTAYLKSEQLPQIVFGRQYYTTCFDLQFRSMWN